MTTDRKQTKYRNRRREPQDAHDRSLTIIESKSILDHNRKLLQALNDDLKWVLSKHFTTPNQKKLGQYGKRKKKKSSDF